MLESAGTPILREQMLSIRRIASSRWNVLVLALLTFVAVIAMLRHGMPMNPDGWAYWQGSVSLLHGLGYHDLAGEPIRLWPPGYSLYLAACQGVLGVSGGTLVVSTALATSCGVLTWGWLAHAFARWRESGAVLANAATLFCALVLIRNARDLRAEIVFHVLLPVTVLILLFTSAAATRRRAVLGCVLLTTCVTALLILRNATVAFVPGLALALAIPPAAKSSRPSRAALPFITVAVAVAVPLAVWSGVRTELGQTGAHRIGVAVAKQPILDYASQLAWSLGDNTSLALVGYLILGVCVFAMLRRDRALDSRAGLRVVVLTAGTLLSLLVCFCVVRLADDLEGRFTVFATLLIAPLGLVDVGRALRPSTAVILVIAALAHPAKESARHVVRGVHPRAPVFTTSPVERMVPWSATLRHSYREGPPVERDGLLIVAPPPFPWLADRGERGR